MIGKVFLTVIVIFMLLAALVIGAHNSSRILDFESDIISLLQGSSQAPDQSASSAKPEYAAGGEASKDETQFDTDILPEDEPNTPSSQSAPSSAGDQTPDATASPEASLDAAIMLLADDASIKPSPYLP